MYAGMQQTVSGVDLFKILRENYFQIEKIEVPIYMHEFTHLQFFTQAFSNSNLVLDL